MRPFNKLNVWSVKLRGAMNLRALRGASAIAPVKQQCLEIACCCLVSLNNKLIMEYSRIGGKLEWNIGHYFRSYGILKKLARAIFL